LCRTLRHLHVWLAFSLTPTLGLSAEVLNWPAAVQEARANNPRLIAQRAEREKAGHQIDVARAAFRPHLTASADVSQSITDPAPGQGTQTYSVGLTLRQSLFAGFRDEAALEERRLGAELAQTSLDRVEASQAFELRSAFARQLYAQLLWDLEKNTALRRRENVRLVTLRFKGGRENRGALLRSEATLAQAEVEVAQAQRQLEGTRLLLAHALGRREDFAQRVDGTLKTPTLTPTHDLNTLASAAFSTKESALGVKTAQAALESAAGEAYPDLSAFATTTRSGPWPPEQDRMVIGLSLSWNLYAGGAPSARLRSQTAAKASAEAAFTDTLMTAREDLHTAQSGLIDAISQVKVRETLFEAAKLQAEIARRQYSLGLVTFLDWDQTENALIDAERSLLASRRDAVLALATWERARGQRLSDLRGQELSDP